MNAPATLAAPVVVDELLDLLVVLSRQIEAHRTAVWHLEQRQAETRQKLIRAGWRPPNPESEVKS